MSGPAGNVYDKYSSRNPIERRLVGRFLDDLRDLVVRSGAAAAHEVGCGEGEISLMLAGDGIRVRGSDVSAAVIAEARRRALREGVEIEYREASITDLVPDHDAAELIICCEVLEHLPDPEHALEAIAALARPWLLLSVPREPLWRALNLARGKYWTDLGNTPGHLGHWSRGRFLRMLGNRVEVVATRAPLPWTMALCRVPT